MSISQSSRMKVAFFLLFILLYSFLIDKNDVSLAAAQTIQYIDESDDVISKYRRQDYKYKLLQPTPSIVGFYTKSADCKLETDHIVSLQDIHISGGYKLNSQQKRNIASDNRNLRLACSAINRMKSNLQPNRFWQVTVEKQPQPIVWTKQTWCEYIEQYYRFKMAYNLSFKNNYQAVFASCGFQLNGAIQADVANYTIYFSTLR